MSPDPPDLSTLLDRTTDGVFALDRDWQITYANETARTVTGVDNLVGRSFNNAFPHVADTRVEAAIDAAMTASESVTTEGYLPDRDRWIEVRAFPIDDGVVVYGRDITHRHDAMTTLESERELLERVLNTSPVGIAIVDYNGTVMRANDRAKSLLHARGVDIVGRPHDAPNWLVPGDDGPTKATELPINRVIETGQSVFDDVVGLSRENGTEQWFSVNAMPMPGAGGGRVVATFEDITDHREYERRITEANERLTLLNRLLRHDIRNDLQVILGWTDLLRSREGCDDDYLDRIENAGEAAVALTETARDLTDLVLSESDPERELEPTPLPETLEKEIQKHRELFPDATFDADPIPDVDVLADSLLGSLFGNVLSNAVRHHDRDRPTVLVSADVDDTTVTVRIADDGPGIPDEVRDTLFKSPGRGLDSDGSGMGLYLVGQLVADYGGEITATPNDPRGTMFTITLQRANSGSTASK